MCYKYPGPRCGSHVRKELDKLQSNLEETERELQTLQDNTRHHAGVPSMDERELSEAIGMWQYRINAKKFEYDCTAEGIDKLQEGLDTEALTHVQQEEIKERLQYAKKYYAGKVLAYDKANKTVNCRKPAKEYRYDDLERFRDGIRDNERKIAKTHQAIIEINDAEQETKLRKRIANYEKQNTALRNKISHGEATQKRVKEGVVPDIQGAIRYRQKAKDAEKRATESWERSDTDGFMSQWASGITAEESRLKAELAENGGKAQFRALFDLDGNYVPARQVDNKYGGMSWGILSNPDDPDSRFSSFVNESKSNDPKKQEALLNRKGYQMGWIKAPAFVTTRGNNLVSVRAVILQDRNKISKDDIEIVTANMYNQPQ